MLTLPSFQRSVELIVLLTLFCWHCYADAADISTQCRTHCSADIVPLTLFS